MGKCLSPCRESQYHDPHLAGHVVLAGPTKEWLAPEMAAAYCGARSEPEKQKEKALLLSERGRIAGNRASWMSWACGPPPRGKYFFFIYKEHSSIVAMEI